MSLLSLVEGCSPDDADRCRSGYYYSEGNCWSEKDSESSSSTQTRDDTETQSLPSGLGDACSTSDDCAGKEASFCAIDPSNPDMSGACTIQDCADGTNECPKDLGLVCCDFANIADHPSICVPQSSYDSLGDFLGC
jgi:hypothetical protein